MLQSTRHGDILELRLDRPPVNALNPELLGALRTAVEAAPGQGALGVVLAGGPGVFSGGMDVPYLMSLGRDRAAVRATWEGFFATAKALADSPIPVVAAIGGHNPAGGCVLTLCCDYRVMARGEFRIGLNEVQVGLAVPEGIQHLMRRLVGTYRAERLLMAGAMVESAEALSLGLVDELADPEHVALRARAWLEDLLKLPQRPMLATRRLARADLVAALADPARIGLDGFLDDWYHPETQAVLGALVARLKGGKRD